MHSTTQTRDSRVSRRAWQSSTAGDQHRTSERIHGSFKVACLHSRFKSFCQEKAGARRRRCAVKARLGDATDRVPVRGKHWSQKSPPISKDQEADKNLPGCLCVVDMACTVPAGRHLLQARAAEKEQKELVRKQTKSNPINQLNHEWKC